jgi:phosphoribosylaminoimidazole-succinocarboxamide synthase
MNQLFKPFISNEVLLPFHQGKVRETYLSTKPNCLLQVPTDRISTHNLVHRSIFDKKERC